MNAPAHSLLERQVGALLEHIASYREASCRELRERARAQAQDLLRATRREARQSVHGAIVEARARLEEGTRRAQARAALEERMRVQRETRLLLDEMWGEIGGALEARWRDPVHRRAWIQAALQQASLVLGGGAWRIEHGPSWPADSRAELDGLPLAPPRQIEWLRDGTISAGLRVRADGVCLDATVAGLTARRELVESAYLAECRAADHSRDEPQQVEKP